MDLHKDEILPDFDHCQECGGTADSFGSCENCGQLTHDVSGPWEDEELDLDEIPTLPVVPKRKVKKATPAQKKYFSDMSLKGRIGEWSVQKKMMEHGWKVMPTVPYNPELGRRTLDEDAIREFLNGHSKQEEILDMLRPISEGHPDLICLKEGRILFVEIKTNTSKANAAQRKCHQLLKKAGYSVEIRRVWVNCQVHYDDPEKPDKSLKDY